MKLKPIEDQVVALMGASSGIGREAALRFAGRGAKVVVSARNEGDLRSLVEEIRGKGGEATAVTAEVTDFGQVEAVARRAVEEYSRLDTWVHLAASSVFARFEDIEPEEFKRVVDVDLTGQAYGAMAALPPIQREGRGARSCTFPRSSPDAPCRSRAPTALPSTAWTASSSRCAWS
jgi:NAD(P)-dependent dehydrogenase (short-subunit alcohol dehydrogenase family)